MQIRMRHPAFGRLDVCPVTKDEIIHHVLLALCGAPFGKNDSERRSNGI
jgi:hypothetical protein